jgi:hypothetical protein
VRWSFAELQGRRAKTVSDGASEADVFGDAERLVVRAMSTFYIQAARS